MKEQYRYKIKSWDICPYLNVNKDFGFNDEETRKRTKELYTKATISTADCKCDKSFCIRNRKCIVARVRY